jgi:hypothetical protein
MRFIYQIQLLELNRAEHLQSSSRLCFVLFHQSRWHLASKLHCIGPKEKKNPKI